MTRILSKKTAEFERAYNSLSVATWNRPRSAFEINAFLKRREAVVATTEL